MIRLKRAIDEYLFERSSRLSAATLAGYTHWLDKFAEWLESDQPLEGINKKTVVEYLRWLKEDYVVTYLGPQEVKPRPLAPKSRKEAYVALSAFFRWAAREYDVQNPLDGIQAPRVPEKQVDPYTREEVRELLEHCEESRRWRTSRRTAVKARRPTGLRDKAMILVLLDTGLRSTELCNLNIGDLHRKTGRLYVREGKGGKDRYVYISAETSRHIRRYLGQRYPNQDPDPGDPLFVCGPKGTCRRFTRFHLRKHLARLGEKANVTSVNVHRFRHTFAIEFLRRGGQELELQRFLGHTSLNMTRRYTKFAQRDLAEAHGRASPVSGLLARW